MQNTYTRDGEALQHSSCDGRESLWHRFRSRSRQAEKSLQRRLKGNKDDRVVTNVQPASKDKEKIVVIRLNC